MAAGPEPGDNGAVAMAAVPAVVPEPRTAATVAEAEGAASLPGAKPRIGDTRPGSPPAPKRRSRKEAAPANLVEGPKPAARTVADSRRSLEASTPAPTGAPDEADDAAKARRPRRRRAMAGDTGPLAVAPGRRPAGAAAGSGTGTGTNPAAPAVAATGAATPGSLRPPAARGTAPEPPGDTDSRARRSNAERRNRPLGRYLMVVHVGPTATQIAVLEGRTLIEHYVSRPADDATQIDGNIYLGRVQNVLPGMEAAFVDIGTPKNAVLYRGDLRYDDDEVERPASDDAKPTRGRLGGAARDARIEQLLRTGQNVICQVTKNPIGTKGARLTQEVSLPGRFVVLIPESDTYGISKRLGDDERRRLRKILDDIRPAGHGLIVRTAAEGATAEELGRDVGRLMRQWEHVQALAKSSRAPSCFTGSRTWPSG